MSRAQLYNRIHEGSLQPQKDGARTYITRAELERPRPNLGRPSNPAGRGIRKPGCAALLEGTQTWGSHPRSVGTSSGLMLIATPMLSCRRHGILN
jgi:hypothetical protein